MTAFLEHANLTVSDPARTARMYQDIFGWRIRWQGAAKDNGYTIHVGEDRSYLAVYARDGNAPQAPESNGVVGGLNHVAVVVDDLDATEARVRDAGFRPHNHADYEPGRRFYFYDHDGIEVEVVSYA